MNNKQRTDIFDDLDKLEMLENEVIEAARMWSNQRNNVAACRLIGACDALEDFLEF